METATASRCQTFQSCQENSILLQGLEECQRWEDQMMEAFRRLQEWEVVLMELHRRRIWLRRPSLASSNSME